MRKYAVYTTEESEKLELQKLTKELGGNLELAVETHCGNEKGKENVKR